MQAQNIINKIWDKHVVSRQKNFPDVLYIDRILLSVLFHLSVINARQ